MRWRGVKGAGCMVPDRDGRSGAAQGVFQPWTPQCTSGTVRCGAEPHSLADDGHLLQPALTHTRCRWGLKARLRPLRLRGARPPKPTFRPTPFLTLFPALSPPLNRAKHVEDNRDETLLPLWAVWLTNKALSCSAQTEARKCKDAFLLAARK